MAVVIPFQGIRYNPAEIVDLAQVVTPPYDVISPQEQIRYYDCHPANVVRLDCNMKTDSDRPGANTYTRSNACFREWLDAGILVKDPVPALYFTAVDFREDGRDITRYGLLALVGLEPFEKGIILPHEKTFSKVKTERLELMKACHANFSPIFTLYPDPDDLHATLQKAVENVKPDIDIVDDHQLRHRMWLITDPEIHRRVTAAMAPSQLFIADGHHRYETALNYRKWLAETSPVGPDHPANYMMMYLCSMKDPGLIIRAAHRLLPEVPKALQEKFFSRSPEFFDIEHIPADEGNAEFMRRLHAVHMENVIGVRMHSRPGYYLFTLKPGVMQSRYAGEIDDAMGELDVTVLTRLLLMDILGFDQEKMDNEKSIAYSSSADEALDAVRAGTYDIGFILNPTRIEQVRGIAASGQIMPRKATYFYPKALTGLVMNSLCPE